MGWESTSSQIRGLRAYAFYCLFLPVMNIQSKMDGPFHSVSVFSVLYVFLTTLRVLMTLKVRTQIDLQKTLELMIHNYLHAGVYAHVI